MQLFNDKTAEKKFVKLSFSFKTLTGRNRFTDAIKSTFTKKINTQADLSTYRLTSKDVEEVYAETKKLYV